MFNSKMNRWLQRDGEKRLGLPNMQVGPVGLCVIDATGSLIDWRPGAPMKSKASERATPESGLNLIRT